MSLCGLPAAEDGAEGEPWPGSRLAPWALRALALLVLPAVVSVVGGEQRSAPQAELIWADERTNALGSPSPDGRYLSFVDADGNLAIRDLEKHTSRALTNTAGGVPAGQFAYFSIFSRDSQHVAYAWFNEDGFYELRIVALDDSTPRTLYRNSEAGFVQPTAFSPDGEQILTLLFRRDNVSQIAVISTSDGTVRVLRSLDWFYPKKLDLSPDGRFVVYDAMPADGLPVRDIHILAVDGSDHAVLTESPANDLFPLWTPDGSAIVFGSDRAGRMGLWRLDMDGGRASGEPVLVKRDIGRALPLAFTHSGHLFYGLRAGRSDVYLGRFDATRRTLVGASQTVESAYAGGNRKPEWSPDGRFLAYLSRIGSENYGQEHRAVTVRELASGDERSHVPRLAFIAGLRWSPDSRSLLLSGSDAQGRSGLFVLDLDTGETVRAVVERSGNFRGLEGDWSLGGSRLYFAQPSAPNRFAIRAHDLESGRRENLYETSAGRAGIRSLRRARNADRLAFVLATGSGADLQSVHVLDIETRQAAPVLHSRYGEISGIEWIAHDQLLVSAEASSGSSLWLVSTTGTEPVQLAVPWKRTGPVRVNPAGDRVTFSYEESKAEVWALAIVPPLQSLR